MIGNERHRYYAHLANSFVRQMAEGLVQGRLQPSAGAYFTLIAQPVRVAPSAALGEETCASIWAKGQQMTLEQAIAYALEE